MSDVDIAPKVLTSENVRIAQFDTAAIRDRISAWDRLPRRYREWHCRHVADPVSVERSSNVTTDALHEYYATALTLDSTDGDQLDPPAELAFGDDDSSFATSDTALNNEIGSRINITDATATNKDLNIDEFISSNELNGETLREVGVFSESGALYQHAPTSTAYAKDSSFALLVNITISHSDA